MVAGVLLALLSLALLDQFVDRFLPLPDPGLFTLTPAVLALGASAGPVVTACARAADRFIVRTAYADGAAVRRLLNVTHPAADPSLAATAAMEEAWRMLALDRLVLAAERDGLEAVVAVASSPPGLAPADFAMHGLHAAMRLTLDAGGGPAALLVGPKGTGERLRPGERELLNVLAVLLGGHLARIQLRELLQERHAAAEQQRAKPREAAEGVRRALAPAPTRRPARLSPASTGAADAAPAPRRAHAALTERECEVPALLGVGASNAAIAGHLSLSNRTVEDVAAHLRRKLVGHAAFSGAMG